MFDVLGKLSTLATAAVEFTRPHPSVPAATDGLRIWVDPKLKRAELRCALAHEAMHIKHGHTSCQGPAKERQIRLEVAQFLIPFKDLQRVAGWARCPEDMAEELDVLTEVVIDRLQTLDGDQIQQLWPANEHSA